MATKKVKAAVRTFVDTLIPWRGQDLQGWMSNYNTNNETIASKIEELEANSGGGTPTDYDDVKAQVQENTEAIGTLNDTVGNNVESINRLDSKVSVLNSDVGVLKRNSENAKDDIQNIRTSLNTNISNTNNNSQAINNLNEKEQLDYEENKARIETINTRLERSVINSFNTSYGISTSTDVIISSETIHLNIEGYYCEQSAQLLLNISANKHTSTLTNTATGTATIKMDYLRYDSPINKEYVLVAPIYMFAGSYTSGIWGYIYLRLARSSSEIILTIRRTTTVSSGTDILYITQAFILPNITRV